MSKNKIVILGISAYYHDSAVAVLVNGQIIVAASEERFTRIKGDSNFPHNAINFCLEAADVNINEVDYIVFYEDSVLKFERILTFAHLTARGGGAIFS